VNAEAGRGSLKNIKTMLRGGIIMINDVLKKVSDALQSAIKRGGFTFVNAWGLAGLVLAISLRKFQTKLKKEA
jgi:hypothetical protein